jgi:hypothetical protein
MPPRKPLVIIAGQIQQLASSDTLDAAVSEVDILNLTNGGAAAAPIGTAVYISGANTFQAARANASGTADPCGLVKDSSIASSSTGAVQTDGVLVGTTAQWDAVTGQTGGLTAGSVYFLSSATAGRITTAAPTASGEYVIRIGKAISSTSIDITIQPPILL